MFNSLATIYWKEFHIRYFNKALDEAEDNNAIYLSNGVYSGLDNTKISITKSVNIIGSDNTTFDGLYENYLFLIKYFRSRFPSPRSRNDIPFHPVKLIITLKIRQESDVFFNDFSGHILDDDTLARLISMPNVIVTSHQAFLTNEALENIAEITAQNLQEFFNTGMCKNELCYHCGKDEKCRKSRNHKCFWNKTERRKSSLRFVLQITG